tara:strand:- start:114 stop:836 length:723 start_codon:yes stop_codon:yes gene_type:complete
MAFELLCPPALIYLIFSLTQIVIDTINGLYNTAILKVWVSFIFTILLNYLCNLGLGIISWVIVFIPFILMTIIVSILLLMFGLDPTTGKIKIQDNDKNNTDKNNTDKKKTTNLGIDVRDQSKKAKEILANSLLSYSEDEQQVSMTTNYANNKSYLDKNMYKLMVYELSNVLSNIGEQKFSVYFKTTALKCSYESSDLSEEKEKKKLINCYQKIYEKINELPDERKERIKNTMDTFIKNIQ